MAMELLFENHTQLDEDVIHYIIEKDYKRPEKAKQYHVMTLLVGILAALAAVYFGRLGILTHQMLTLLCTIALIAVCIYSFYSYYQNMPKNQIKARQNTYSESLLIPRKMKVYKNVMYQSAGKSHGEYRLFQFTGIETWSHYFLLRYENSYVVIYPKKTPLPGECHLPFNGIAGRRRPFSFSVFLNHPVIAYSTL